MTNLKKDIEKIILSKGKQNEAHFDLFVLDTIKEISALFSTREKELLEEIRLVNMVNFSDVDNYFQHIQKVQDYIEKQIKELPNE